MLSADTDDKSLQSFRIPLEIVREDPKHEQHHYSSTPVFGGDLLLTVTYKRNIVKVISLRNQIKSRNKQFLWELRKPLLAKQSGLVAFAGFALKIARDLTLKPVFFIVAKRITSNS